MMVYQLKRVLFDLTLSFLLLALLMTGAYASAPNPIQLLVFKAVLISLAFLHAHILGKLAFPSVNWRGDYWRPAHFLRIALYVVFVFGYSTGG